MNKTKPFELISTRFQVSRESAKYFLVRVQRSFKTEKPPHQLIVEFMNGYSFETLPWPHQVAAMMHENGVWTKPLHPAPPIPVDEEDFYEE